MNWYLKKYHWLNAHPRISKFIVYLCKTLSLLIYFAYIMTLIYLCFQKDILQVLSFVCIPASGFLIETMLRAKINAPRPYEVLSIPPLDPKDTKGKSFPSRHAFSAAILSIAFYTIHPYLGWILILFSLFIGLCRILMGVHWIRDVCIGLLFGWSYGLIGFLFWHLIF